VVIETRPMRLSLVETYKVPHILSCENLKPYVVIEIRSIR